VRQPVRSVHVRLPKTLHEKLIARAADEGVSLSLLVATLLAAADPFDFRPDPDEPPLEPDPPGVTPDVSRSVSAASESSRGDDAEPEPDDSSAGIEDEP
jgi:hypothetical protein